MSEECDCYGQREHYYYKRICCHLAPQAFISNLRDGEIVAACQGKDLTSIAERGTHYNRLVSKLLIVVEDTGDRYDTCREVKLKFGHSTNFKSIL